VGTSRDEYGRLVLGDIITAIIGTKVRNSSDLYKVLDKAMVSAVSGDQGSPLAVRAKKQSCLDVNAFSCDHYQQQQ
jgi:hypothetical protein